MESFDLLVVGGGINGTAIARDAAGRGASVLLVEKDDLAAHTSSASSKLIHGGLRYLEYGEVRLVREALAEREVLLRTAPHLVRPLAFVLPQPRRGRPWWKVRAGLKLYDLLAWRGSLPRSRSVRDAPYAAPLKPRLRRKLALYWDAWVDDARLAILNAVDAADHGAQIATRTELLSATRNGDVWIARLSGDRTVTAGTIVNAAGPWVAEVLGQRLGETSAAVVRLVRGSHVVVPRLYDGDHAYILQQPDGRVVFALPYGAHSLIGTTDAPAAGPDDDQPTDEEVRYLCESVDRYFDRQVCPKDVVWRFAGIRALYDDGATDAKAVTRDYRLELDDDPGAKLLSVFGGKITTARALAVEALDLIGIEGRKWTVHTPLPGGDISPAFNTWFAKLRSWLPEDMLVRMAQAYGTRLREVIGDAQSLDELGAHHGAGLYERELVYLIAREFAVTAEDVLWRRTKLGLRMSETEMQALQIRMSSTP